VSRPSSLRAFFTIRVSLYVAAVASMFVLFLYTGKEPGYTAAGLFFLVYGAWKIWSDAQSFVKDERHRRATRQSHD
jgi:hypothetical protein